MKNSGTIFGREPVAVVFTIMSVLQVLIAFGLSISAEQLAVLNTALGAIFALIARSQSMPVVGIPETAVIEMKKARDKGLKDAA